MPLNRAPARLLTIAAIAFPAVGGPFASAEAKVVTLPEGKPKIAIDVPDDWTVTPWANGVDLQSADKNVIIVAGMAKPTKTDVQAWQKEASRRMMSLGVVFDRTAKPTPPAPKPSQPAAATVGAEAPEAVFGAPSLALPGQAPALGTATEDATVTGLAPMQAPGKAAANKGPRFRFKVVTLYGASYGDRPVDAQFLNFAVDKDTALLMQQESGSTDDRVGPVVNSVRPAP